MLNKLKNFVLDILFPKFCLCCGREKDYLCPDCRTLLEVVEDYYCLCRFPKRIFAPGKCPRCRTKKLNGLYSSVSYKSHLAKKLIRQFKYKPYIKDLSRDLSFLIITHFILLNHNFNNNTTKTVEIIRENFSKYILIPVPLYKKRMKERGFNQSEEIGKELAKFLKIPLIKNNLIKTKETLSQTKLTRNEREENIKNAFSVKNGGKIKRKKILLIDDIYTTGATMEECARILKKSGARSVWGVAVARE